MRIVIAEDSAILREGLAQLLGMRGHEIVAAVTNPATLKKAVADHAPDVAVIDIRMPPTHTDEGLQAALALRRTHPTLGVLLFSQYIETRFVRELLAEGSSGVGYLLKERVSDLDEFTAALDRIATGGTALDPEVVTQLFGAAPREGGITTLSPRERQVLELMAEGRTNSAIAKQLTVTDRAIEKHVANIFTKLNLPPSDDDHRRVLSVLRYLEGQ
jgi:DNA-binding NarL/FixJ family response regulator